MMQQFIDKLIGRLEEESKFAVSLLGGKTSSYIAGCCDTNKKTISIINQLAEEYKGGWIPCSERVPEHKHNLLLCLKSGYVGEGYYSARGFCDVNSYPYDDVIAWMPLPSPYKKVGAV